MTDDDLAYHAPIRTEVTNTNEFRTFVSLDWSQFADIVDANTRISYSIQCAFVTD